MLQITLTSRLPSFFYLEIKDIFPSRLTPASQFSNHVVLVQFVIQQSGQLDKKHFM